MSKTNWMEQLEVIVARPIRRMQVALKEWERLAEAESAAGTSGAQADPEHSNLSNAAKGKQVFPGAYVSSGSRIWFALQSIGSSVEAIEMECTGMTATEIDLIAWTLAQVKKTGNSVYSGMPESERQALELGSWIVERLNEGDTQGSVPDRLLGRGRAFSTMIPFLIVTEQSESGRTNYSELEKLLRTFLAEEVILIPLEEQEWLILGPVSLIHDAQSEEREDDTEEVLEESLASIASGLHDMLASEWIGECHLTVSHPISPSNSIVATTALLRETIQLGRAFHVGSNIHLPWLLQLERLLSAIPEGQRIRFVEHALKRTDAFLEPEMLTTLETFFSLDCNVSETAKKLYIHRNTLLYRLDKLKQEAELDVRQFRDAVLVNIILLLYKVTKRN